MRGNIIKVLNGFYFAWFGAIHLDFQIYHEILQFIPFNKLCRLLLIALILCHTFLEENG